MYALVTQGLDRQSRRLVLDVDWFRTAAAANALVSDHYEWDVTDPLVTPDLVERTLRERSRALDAAVPRYLDIQARVTAIAPANVKTDLS